MTYVCICIYVCKRIFTRSTKCVFITFCIRNKLLYIIYIHHIYKYISLYIKVKIFWHQLKIQENTEIVKIRWIIRGLHRLPLWQVYMCIYLFIWIFICMHVYIYIYVYVYKHINIGGSDTSRSLTSPHPPATLSSIYTPSQVRYICMYVNFFAWIYLCIYISTCICMYLCIYIYM
jgi:hypothetical protein